MRWDQIKTVLLDMDGTLLDLHFDNHFWLEYVPKLYADKHDISLEKAKAFLVESYHKVAGTIQWYCLDHWQQTLDIDIVAAKRDVEHLIAIRDDATEFLEALRQSGREVILVTNAHPDSLALKVEHTHLDKYIDTLISTHQYGVTKESQKLWQALQQDFQFEKKSTLFVDDSITILESAQMFGIKHLLAVANPDSKQPSKMISQFQSTLDFREFTQQILSSSVK